MTDRTQPEAVADCIFRLRGLRHVDRHEVAHAMESMVARIADLEAQLEAIGAGGVSGPLMGQPQAMPDISALTERGAKAWAGVDAQGLREGFTAADVWDAWHVRTMSQDDFEPVDESETPTEIADAVLALLAAQPAAQAEGCTAEQALRNVLAAVQRHMPPDGPDAKDTLSEIIAIVDPWPLGPLEKS